MNKLKELLTEKGIKQAVLARKLKITPQALHAYIKAEHRKLPRKHWTALIEFLEGKITENDLEHIYGGKSCFK